MAARPSYWPSWWTPEAYRESVQAITEMTECLHCGGPVKELRELCKWCPRCRTAHTPVPDYETLERELIMDALAGED